MEIPRSVSSAIGRSWVREERKRIRKEIREAFEDLKLNNPGESDCEWMGALRAMYEAAIKRVRR